MGSAEDKVREADERRRKIRVGVNRLKAKADELRSTRRDLQVEIGNYKSDCGTDVLKLLAEIETREAEVSQLRADLSTMQNAVGTK